MTGVREMRNKAMENDWREHGCHNLQEAPRYTAPVRERALKDGFLCGDRVTTASSMRHAAGWCMSTNSLRSPWDVGMSVLWKISSMPLSLMGESGKLCIQQPVIQGVCMCTWWGGGGRLPLQSYKTGPLQIGILLPLPTHSLLTLHNTD